MLAVTVISIQPLGQFGQEPEPSQATSMALVRCILGKFLGAVCHCFPPAFRHSNFCHQMGDPSSESWKVSGNFAYMASIFTPLGIFYMPQTYDMEPTALLPLRRKAC